MVTNENYEEYLMLDADGELDSTAKAALQAFIAANPALQDEAAAWQSLKLRPYAPLPYPDKEALLKRAPKGIVLTLRPYLFAAAAAVLAAIILIPALWNHDHQDPGIAQFAHPESIATPAKAVKQGTGTHIAVRTPAITPIAHQYDVKISKSGVRTQQPASAHILIAQRSSARDSILALHITSHPAEELPAAVHAPQKTQEEIYAAVEPAAPQAHHLSGLPHIHLAAANKPAFDLLKEGLETRIAQASAAAKSIKETAVVIRLGNGKINLNF